MSTRDRAAARNLFFGLLLLTTAVGVGLIAPPPAHAAICNSKPVGDLDYSDALGPSTIQGTGDAEVIMGSEFDDTIDGGGGDDIICGGEGMDVIHGGNGGDVIYGDGTASGSDIENHIYGDNGNDNLHGDIEDDTINGGDGDDELYGGPKGDDTIFANDDSNSSNDHVDGEGSDGGSGDICYVNGTDTHVNCP